MGNIDIYKELLGEQDKPQDMLLNLIPIRKTEKAPIFQYKKHPGTTSVDWSHIYNYGRGPKWPLNMKYNYGAVCGPSGGYIVVDVDNAKLFNSAVVEAEGYDITETYCVRSADQHDREDPTKGLFRGHLYYTYDAQLHHLCGKNKKDFVDTIGFEVLLNKYFVVAESSSMPNIHGVIKHYVRYGTKGPADMAPPPNWLKAALGVVIDEPEIVGTEALGEEQLVAVICSKARNLYDAGGNFVTEARSNAAFEAAAWMWRAGVTIEVIEEKFLEPFMVDTGWPKSKYDSLVNRIVNGMSQEFDSVEFEDRSQAVIELKADESVSTVKKKRVTNGILYMRGIEMLEEVERLLDGNVKKIVGDKNTWVMWNDKKGWVTQTDAEIGNVVQAVAREEVIPYIAGYQDNIKQQKNMPGEQWANSFIVDLKWLPRECMPSFGNLNNVATKLKDWDNDKYIKFENGVISFENRGTIILFEPEKKEFMLRICMPTALKLPYGRHDWKSVKRRLEGDASGALMMKTYRSLFQNEVECDYVQRCLGYAFTGRKSEKAFFILKGEADSGKSLLLHMITEATEPWSRIVDKEIIYTSKSNGNGHSANAHHLMGGRFGYIDELSDSRKFEADTVKRMVTELKTKTSGKGTGEVEWRPKMTYFFVTNVVPKFERNDGGLTRRMKFLKMSNKFVEYPDRDDPKQFKVIPGLLERISKGSVWLFLLLGMMRWAHKGLSSGVPEDFRTETNTAMDDAGDELMTLLDSILKFQGKASKNHVRVPDLWGHLKTRYGHSYPEIKKLAKKTLTTILNKSKYAPHMKNMTAKGETNSCYRLMGYVIEEIPLSTTTTTLTEGTDDFVNSYNPEVPFGVGDSEPECSGDDFDDF